MRRLVQLVCMLTFTCTTVWAQEGALAAELIRSSYQVHYDPQSEMTDVTLLSAYLTNQADIKHISEEVVAKYSSITNWADRNIFLEGVFQEISAAKDANIQFYREVVADQYYRLEKQPPPKTFAPYSWDEGRFTNKYPFYMVLISRPPSITNNFWTLYGVQAQAGTVSVRTNAGQLLLNEGFYGALYGLPNLVRFNMILQTADLQAAKLHEFSGQLLDPAAWRWFKLDENRLRDALTGTAKFGRWVVADIGNGNLAVKQVSLISPDGIDHQILRVLLNSTNVNQIYLAYVRDPNTHDVIALSAWDYENGSLVRFLRIERPLGVENLKAYAQYIIHTERTKTNMALFNVDISQYPRVFDQRPAYPIETLNGKVIFDARQDKYRELPQLQKRASYWFLTRTAKARVLMVMAMLVPPLVIAFAFKRRKVQ